MEIQFLIKFKYYKNSVQFAGLFGKVYHLKKFYKLHCG